MRGSVLLHPLSARPRPRGRRAAQLSAPRSAGSRCSWVLRASSRAEGTAPMASWSVWLEPPPGRLRDQLQKLINDMSEEYGTPPFEPHVTLQGGISGTEEEVLEKTRELAGRLGQYSLRFSDLAVGDFFFQYVLLLMVQDPPVMEANRVAREVYGMDPAAYMPHLSVVYGPDEGIKADVYNRVRELLYGAGAGYDSLLVDSGYNVEQLSVWKTDGEDKTLQSWVRVADVPLPPAKGGGGA
mmetsp:Transcript_5493/g.18579  ORF Transcript_5493/g.18579 Transcript_5493/m.18579 type:complete len:240 (+) Transcript_5493:72-791(+)